MKPKVIASLTALALGSSAYAATVTLNPSADATVNFRSGNAASTTNFGTAGDLDLFYQGAIWAMAYVKFDLSSLAGATITDATLTFTKVTNIANITPAARNDAINTGRFGLFGLLDVAGNTPQNWDETTITGSMVRSDLLTTEITSDTTSPQFDTTTRTISFDGVGESTNGTTVSVTNTTGDALINFLQARLDAETAFAESVTFIADFVDHGTSGRGFAVGSREDAVNAPVLTITYTAAVPEPASAAALAGLGILGFAATRRRRAA